MNEPERVVFDSNVFFQALISAGGPAGSCLAAVEHGDVFLFVSRLVFAELRDVCLRPHIARRFRLSETRIDAFILDAQKCSTIIENIPHVFEYPRDPDDAHYVDLAVAARARLIVSRDNDLLALKNAADPIGADFQRRFPDLAILTHEELLIRLRSKRGSKFRYTPMDRVTCRSSSEPDRTRGLAAGRQGRRLLMAIHAIAARTAACGSGTV